MAEEKKPERKRGRPRKIDEKQDQQDFDISGLTFNGQIRPSYDSSTLTATFTISIVTAASGIYKLQLADTVTKDISSGRYVYDVMMTLADSTIEVVHKGILTVNPRVTQL